MLPIPSSFPQKLTSSPERLLSDRTRSMGLSEMARGPRSERPTVAWCLEVRDLVLAKLAAGRPHDFTFVEDVIRFELVDVEQLQLGVDLMPSSHRDRIREWLARLIADPRS